MIFNKKVYIGFLILLIGLISGCYSYTERYVSRPNLSSDSDMVKFSTLDSLFFMEITPHDGLDYQSYGILFKYLFKGDFIIDSLDFSIIHFTDTLKCNYFRVVNVNVDSTYENFNNLPIKYRQIHNKKHLKNTSDFYSYFALRLERIVKDKQYEFPPTIKLIIKTKLINIKTMDTLYINKKYIYYKYSERGSIRL